VLLLFPLPYTPRTPSLIVLAWQTASGEGTARTKWVIGPIPMLEQRSKHDSKAPEIGRLCSCTTLQGAQDPPRSPPGLCTVLRGSHQCLDSSSPADGPAQSLSFFDVDQPLSIAEHRKVCRSEEGTQVELCNLFPSSAALQDCLACILALGLPVSRRRSFRDRKWTAASASAFFRHTRKGIPGNCSTRDFGTIVRGRNAVTSVDVAGGSSHQRLFIHRINATN
jgi:hypothetical protein